MNWRGEAVAVDWQHSWEASLVVLLTAGKIDQYPQLMLTHRKYPASCLTFRLLKSEVCTATLDANGIESDSIQCGTS